MKKILLVTRPIAPPWDEASKNFAYNLALNLPDFEFGILTSGVMENLPENIKQYPIYTSNKLTNYQRAKLLKLIKIRNNYDILHVMLTPGKLNSFCFKNFILNKKIKTIQTIATLREDLLQDKDFEKILFADKIVTYSKYAKEKLNNLGFDNVEQIYPGIDLELYRPAEKDRNLIENLKLKIENFIVTYPGEFSRLGATDDIVNMIISNAATFKEKNIKIIFACRVKNKNDRKKQEEIQKKLEEKGLLDLVRFPDTFITLEKMFNISDLVIFPVREMKGKFDVPLAVIEAMACGKPVIISDLPILREFSNNKNSVIIKSGDFEELKNAILDLYNNKEKREIIGKNAKQFTEENFDIKKIAKKYTSVYESL